MSKITGTFKRVSPTSSRLNANVPLGWVAFHFNWMPLKSDRRRAHGEWYRFTSAKGSVHRLIRFASNAKRDKAKNSGEIAIDWPGWLELNGFEDDVDGSLEISIKKVPLCKLPFVFRSHPDPMYRLAVWLGWLSFGLGVFSLTTSIIIWRLGIFDIDNLIHLLEHAN